MLTRAPVSINRSFVDIARLIRSCLWLAEHQAWFPQTLRPRGERRREPAEPITLPLTRLSIYVSYRPKMHISWRGRYPP